MEYNLEAYIPLLLLSLLIGAFCFYLGVQKGYKGIILLIAWIPLVNIFATALFLGLPDRKLHQKLDRLLYEIEKSKPKILR